MQSPIHVDLKIINFEFSGTYFQINVSRVAALAMYMWHNLINSKKKIDQEFIAIYDYFLISFQ